MPYVIAHVWLPVAVGVAGLAVAVAAALLVRLRLSSRRLAGAAARFRHTADEQRRADREKIEWLLGNAEGAAKFFVGYAGWGAGQLESEMETGSWLTTGAASQQVFAEDARLWSKLTTSLTVGGGMLKPDDIPDDPSIRRAVAFGRRAATAVPGSGTGWAA